MSSEDAVMRAFAAAGWDAEWQVVNPERYNRGVAMYFMFLSGFRVHIWKDGLSYRTTTLPERNNPWHRWAVISVCHALGPDVVIAGGFREVCIKSAARSYRDYVRSTRATNDWDKAFERSPSFWQGLPREIHQIQDETAFDIAKAAYHEHQILLG